MNKQEFEKTLTMLPQDFFFFEENLGRWASIVRDQGFMKGKKDAIPEVKPDGTPLTDEDLKLAFQQMMSLTHSFKEGKTIAEAISICEKQLNRKLRPDSDFDFDVEVFK